MSKPTNPYLAPALRSLLSDTRRTFTPIEAIVLHEAADALDAPPAPAAHAPEERTYSVEMSLDMPAPTVEQEACPFGPYGSLNGELTDALSEWDGSKPGPDALAAFQRIENLIVNAWNARALRSPDGAKGGVTEAHGWRAGLEALISQILEWRGPERVPQPAEVLMGHDDAISAARKLIGEGALGLAARGGEKASPVLTEPLFDIAKPLREARWNATMPFEVRLVYATRSDAELAQASAQSLMEHVRKIDAHTHQIVPVREAEKNATPFVVDREKVMRAVYERVTTRTDYARCGWSPDAASDAAITEYERQRAEHEKGGAA